MRRVVVTGLGVVSPVGSKIDTFWSNIVNGKNGIDYITYFDTTTFKVKIAAEVKDFDASEYFERIEARKMDLFSQYAVAAADQAIKDSGLEADKVDSTRFGGYVGSGSGGIRIL